MNQKIVTAPLIFLTCLMVGYVTAAPNEKTRPVFKNRDATEVIKQNQLEKVNIWVADWISLLVAGDPKKATALLLSKGISNKPSDKEREAFKRLCVSLAGLLASRSEIDCELVAYIRISSRSIVLYYAINTQRGVVLITLRLYKKSAIWRFKEINGDGNNEEHVKKLSRADRFSTLLKIYPKPKETSEQKNDAGKPQI